MDLQDQATTITRMILVYQDGNNKYLLNITGFEICFKFD